MNDKRRRIWIDPFQTGLLIRICMYCLIYQVASWAFFSVYEWAEGSLTPLKASGPLLGGVGTRSVLAFLVLVPPLTLDAVRFAHRLVGPLYRFRKTMEAIAAGEPVELVKLRDGDMLLDFRDTFNAMLEQLERQGLVLIRRPDAAANAVPVPATCGAATDTDRS